MRATRAIESLLATLALVAAPGCGAPASTRCACPSITEQLATATVIEIGDGLADWGKTVDGTWLGKSVDVRLMVTRRAGRNVEVVVGGDGRALRIPISKLTTMMPVDGVAIVDAAAPRPYSEGRHAFEGAPPFHGSSVLVSYKTFIKWDEAWLVTREGDQLVVWLATGPYEDVTTEDATWERFVLVQLAKGATVST